MTEISVAELRKASEVLLDHLEEVAGSTIVLDEDYFWSIFPDRLYDVEHPPTLDTLGSLADSLESVRSGVADPDGRLGYHLVWLADLLRFAGHRYPG